MRFWTLLSGFSWGLAFGAFARSDDWAALFFVVFAVFCWLAPRGWPPEDGIESFRAARRAMRGGE